MKRKKTGRKVMAVALSLVMGALAPLSLSMTAFADGYTYDGTGTFEAGTASMTDKEGKTHEVEVPVEAKLSGGGGVYYRVAFEWGAMQFEYDYGMTWDPEQHKYIPGTSGKPGGGWNMDQVDGIKNRIRVTNAGNFPVVINFAYAMEGDPFGTPTSGKPVGGVFSYDNDDLADKVSANVLDPASYAVPAAMNLNPYNSSFTWSNGDPYYYVGTDDNEYTKDIYFSLMGTPAVGLTMDPWTQVGKITATISPATGVTQAFRVVTP